MTLKQVVIGKTTTLVLVAFLCSQLCMAQKKGIVMEMGIRMPIGGVQLYTNTGHKVVSDSVGRFFIPFAFGSVTVTHAYYLNRIYEFKNMPDTLYLLPKGVNLDEVVVTGRAPKIGFDIKKMTSFPQYNRGGGFDFFSLFERRVSAKERERRRKAIENY